MNCKELGYKVGDEFEVIKPIQFQKGTIVKLVKYEKDGSSLFDVVKGNSNYERSAGIYDGFHNLKPLEKTMDIKEAYKVMAQNCGIKVGDTVKVLRKFEDYENGADACWNSEMAKTLNKDGNIIEVDDYTYKVQFSDPMTHWWFPFFVLEKIKDGVEPIELEDYTVIFKDGGTIEVGCQTIDFEMVKKIYDRAKSTL